MQAQDQLRQAPVVPARAHAVRQRQKLRLTRRVGGLQRRLQRQTPQLRRAVLVRYRKVRVQPRARGVLPQDRRAEAVYRLYRRAAHQRRLAPQPLRARLLRPAPLQLLRYPAAQLRRRRGRKRDDQKVLHARRALALRHPAHQPLRQDPRLAASRRRGDQKLAAPVLYRQLLRCSRLKCRHRPRLLPKCPTRAWRSASADSAGGRRPRPP